LSLKTKSVLFFACRWPIVIAPALEYRVFQQSVGAIQAKIRQEKLVLFGADLATIYPPVTIINNVTEQ
jgi:hypothetical protein